MIELALIRSISSINLLKHNNPFLCAKYMPVVTIETEGMLRDAVKRILRSYDRAS
jgi:hypothetical protein